MLRTATYEFVIVYLERHAKIQDCWQTPCGRKVHGRKEEEEGRISPEGGDHLPIAHALPLPEPTKKISFSPIICLHYFLNFGAYTLSFLFVGP